MDNLEKIKGLEIKIAEQAAVIRYAGLRWVGFVVVGATSSLMGMMGAIAALQEMPEDTLIYSLIMGMGLLGGILAGFQFRRTHRELKGLEKELLGMHTELAELGAEFYRER